jgi:UDP-glucuronate 4-epimerase
MNMLPMQPGDVPATWADVDDLVADFDYKPGVRIQEGTKRFVEWYLDFFGKAQQVSTGSFLTT